MKEVECPATVREAFSQIQVGDALKEKALNNLARWLCEDAFADARQQLDSLIEEEKYNLLFDAFFQEIPFGTGGRRGPVGFGTNRINPFTISTSIEGHSQFLKKRFAKVPSPAVVVAFDVRVFKDLRAAYDRGRPNPLLGMTSKDFATIAASVYAANGIRVWMPDPSQENYISTPELSFAIRFLEAQGGLNVSASHNHPDDNGAKIYSDKGSQEIPPVDEQLAKIVEATTSASSMPFDEARERGLVTWLPPEVFESYLETNSEVSRDRDARSARVIFTPLHGTGYHSAGIALERAGFQMEVYPGDAQPDGTFEGIPFRSPNPEVPQSLLRAQAYAQARGGDLVLGTDPDADRLGMMASHQGEWVFFNGNEIGVLLTHYLLAQEARSKKVPSPSRFAVTTVVTTSLFGRIARAFGLHVVDDLGVGFKYIADVINSIESTGRYRDIVATTDDFVIGIEESHGYLVVPSIRDKDAAGAAVLLAELASQLKESGKSFSEYLDDVYREFGYVRNLVLSTVMLGAKGFFNIRQIQDSLRERQPEKIGDRKVLEMTDRWSEEGPLGKIHSETERMSRDLLVFRLEGDARIILRPSGTESKNKVYVEVCGKPLGESVPADALPREKAKLDRIAEELGRAFTQEMLSRIGVELPDYALEVSGLVALENKEHFAKTFLPELVARLERSEGGAELDEWIDTTLKPYGADGRMLVEPAVHAYLKSTSLPEGIAAALAAAFSHGGANSR